MSIFRVGEDRGRKTLIFGKLIRRLGANLEYDNELKQQRLLYLRRGGWKQHLIDRGGTITSLKSRPEHGGYTRVVFRGGDLGKGRSKKTRSSGEMAGA